MKKLLWLDDFRNPSDYVVGDYDISLVKSYAEFCKFITDNSKLRYLVNTKILQV